MNHKRLRKLLVLLIAVAALPVAASDVPAGFSRVVLLATEKIEIDKDVEIVSGDVIVNDADGELKVDKDGTTPADFRLAADSVEIKQNVVVGGDVAYNELDNDGTVLGDLLTPLALPVFAALPPFEAASPGTDDVSVDAGETLVLAAGDYGTLDVDKEAILIFSGGTYSFEEVKIEKDVSWTFEALSRVRIADKLEVKDGCRIGPADGSGTAPADILFFVGDDAKLEKECVFSANVYAPDGKIEIKKDVVAVGSFIGREIKIDKNVTLTVDSAFNEAPVAVDDSATVDEGGAVSVLDSRAASVLANDSDPNPSDVLTVTTTPVAGPDNGVVLLAADGTFTYTHDGSDTLADAFVYEVCDDGVPVHCATATVTITVNPVNDAPVAGDDSAETDEDMAVVIDVLANDSDVDGQLDPSSVQVVSGPASGGTAVDAGTGAVTYTPDADFFGTDSFDYEVCDDGVPPPVLCDTATVTVTVNAVNDAPVAGDDSAETDEDMAVVIDVLANDSDVDGQLDPSSVQVVSGPASGGTAVDAGTGAVTYTPDADFFGTDSFDYEVCDDGVPPPVLCDTATVTVTVDAVNDAPNIRPDQATGTVNQSVVVAVLANDDDPDGVIDPSSVQVVTAVNDGIAMVAVDGSITVVPDAGFTGLIAFSYQACDDGVPPPVLCGTASVEVEIFGDNQNRPPVARNAEAQTDPGVTVTIRLTATDQDGDFMTFSIAGGPSQGVLGLVRPESGTSATVDYTPADDASGSDSFTFLVDDGNGGTDTGTVTISLAAVNRPPEARDDVAIVARGDSIAMLVSDATSVSANDSDPDGDGLVVDTTPVSGPDHGTLALFADGSFLYTHDDGFDTEDAFVYQVCDTAVPALCDTATVRIEIRQTTVAVTIEKAGAGSGRVSSSPAGIDCGAVCSADFATATRISLFATPDPGSTFVGFTGDGDCQDGELLGLADVTCVATFDELPPPADTATLTIVKEGAGRGTVASNPRGIQCGADCSAAFPLGTAVALLVRPDDGASVFVGWTGDADCTDGMVTMTADLTCIATFDEQ